MRMKIISVVGGRPNFIKLAAVCAGLSQSFEHLVLHTGQHYDFNLSGSFFKELDLPKPQENLSAGSGSHAQETSKVMTGCEAFFQKAHPDLVIVYGDMNSTLGAALTSAKLNIPVAHVEAGIRSFDHSMPEEINRIVTDHLSSLLFSPTATASSNLKQEGLANRTVEVGDTMYDSFLRIQAKIDEDYIRHLGLTRKKYYLVTIHRQSNTDNKENLQKILQAILELNDNVIYLLHPRTREKIKRYKLEQYIQSKKVIVREPVTYIESLSLQKYAKFILTDSGGIQREAYWLKVPGITFRDTTEWPETVESGWNILWYKNPKPLSEIVNKFKIPQEHPDFSGDGNAGKKISQSIKDFFHT